jgi:hypothetical protein
MDSSNMSIFNAKGERSMDIRDTVAASHRVIAGTKPPEEALDVMTDGWTRMLGAGVYSLGVPDSKNLRAFMVGVSGMWELCQGNPHFARKILESVVRELRAIERKEGVQNHFVQMVR